MITEQLKVKSDELRLKNAGDFVEMTSAFKSSVYIEVGNKRVNAKSVIGVMSLNVGDGQLIKVLINGEDEEQAMAAVTEYFN